MKSESASYKAAGVDITAGYRAVELMKKHVARTMIPGVLEGIGGFGAGGVAPHGKAPFLHIFSGFLPVHIVLRFV